MLRFIGLLFMAALVVAVIVTARATLMEYESERGLDQQMNQALLETRPLGFFPAEKGQALYLLERKLNLDEAFIERLLRRNDAKDADVIYGGREFGEYTMSAPGTDRRQHLVHSYLEGYQPFAADNFMLPMYVMARRKSYLRDAKQYDGREEVWQTSREAFLYPSGDCEDHAVALADWLIEMGEDARVVTGLNGSDGHAWVVLFKDGREYLLEATSKGFKRDKPYPLASLSPDYHPEYMFNREYFWVNTGSRLTSSYSGSSWKQRSRFTRGAKASS